MLVKWIVRAWSVRKVRRSDALRRQRRLRTLIRLWTTVLRWSPDDRLKALNSYQLGSLLWGDAGEGERSSDLFRHTIGLSTKGPVADAGSRRLVANASENLLALSLSYDEYEHWASMLKVMQPNNVVLGIHVPRIQLLRDRGAPWALTMEGQARLFGAGLGAGPSQFSIAAAILQRMLTHKHELGLSRQQWRRALDGYCLMISQVAGHCDLDMRRASEHYDPTEFSFILRDAIPLAQEYADTFPADPHGRRMLDMLRHGVDLAEGGIDAAGRQAVSSETSPPPTHPFYWRSRAELNAAIVSLGLQGLRFELRTARVVTERKSGMGFRALELRFAELQPLTEEQRPNASLALRCSVGMTVPSLASAHGSIGVGLSDDVQYQVRLHTGVPLHAYIFHVDGSRYGPVQMTSRYEGLSPMVLIAPFAVTEETLATEETVLNQVARAFEAVKGSILEFYSGD